MRGASRFALALACGFALISEPAAAEPESVWEDVARPGRAQAAALVERAAALLDRSPAQAASLLERAVSLDGRRADAFYLLGAAHYLERAWVGCADALERARRLDPSFVPSPRQNAAVPLLSVEDMLGLCLVLAGRYDAGIAHYRRMLLAPPGGVSLDFIHGNLADCYLALGRLDEAIAELNAGLALAPRRPLLWYGLAVAYDRDERVARARDAMLRALELDPQLGELGSPGTFFAPPEDGAYTLGLAHQIAAEADPPRRAAAIAQFRRYLALSPSGPWSERARRHLAELGPTTLGVRDVTVHPHDEPAVAARLAEALPDLQRCFEGHPHLATRVTLTFVARPRRGLRPEAGTVTLQALGTGTAPTEVNGCLEKRLQGVRHASQRLVRLSMVLLAR